MKAQALTPSWKNRAILSLSLVVVMLGFGMVAPIFPFYIERMGAVGSMLRLLVATAALSELLFGPLWGSISDRTGRKPVLMIGMLGYGLAMLLFGLSTELLGESTRLPAKHPFHSAEFRLNYPSNTFDTAG